MAEDPLDFYTGDCGRAEALVCDYSESWRNKVCCCEECQHGRYEDGRYRHGCDYKLIPLAPKAARSASLLCVSRQINQEASKIYYS